MEFFSQPYAFIPNFDYARELARPWKLATFGLGMTWLFFGALTYEIADWDVGVSIVMGVLTYLCAPWSVYVLGSAFRFRPRFWWLHALAALAIAVLVVDVSYLLYHSAVRNPVYRDANFRASMPLYFLAGTIWLYRGTVRSFFCGVRSAISRHR